MPRGTALDAIQRLSAWSPEGSLVAAMIRLALEDSLAGNADARIWLASADCERWLTFVVPPGVDEGAVQMALLRVVDDRVPSTPATRASRSTGRARGMKAWTTARRARARRAASGTRTASAASTW
ncbi:MAG TPA: hypothetical protein VFN57_19305 [Thermomicrobiaceae bacterium]|nr:hypothetical protein [Thermomicrobiaceae bacterium]